MKSLTTLLAGSAALATVALAAPSQAFTAVPGDSGLPLCSASNITNIQAGSLLGCAGSYAGNADASSISKLASLSSLTPPGTWSFSTADKSDNSSTNGIFTSNPEYSTGTLTFDAPQLGIFAVALKAANAYSLYLFDGGTTGGITSFDFSTAGTSVNGRGIAQALSHASFYRFTPETTDVPEPMGLLGMAGVGLGVAAMRRRK